MLVLTSQTSGTYKARIHSSAETGFQPLYTGTCTESERGAACNLVMKYYGSDAAATLEEQKDPKVIHELMGDWMNAAKRKQVFRLWTFSMSARPSSETPKLRNSGVSVVDAEVVADAGAVVAEPLHNLYHRCAQTAAAQATGYAILCGLELARIRSEISRPGKRSDLATHVSSGWEKWVEENCEFNIRTAQRYMAVAEGVKGRIAQATASRHLTNILDLAPSALAGAQREQLLKTVSKVTEGATLTQLYLDFGITKANPRDNLRKGGATHHQGRTMKDINAEDAQAEACILMSALAKWIHAGRHQIVPKDFLRQMDDQLLAARETLKPLLK